MRTEALCCDPEKILEQWLAHRNFSEEANCMVSDQTIADQLRAAVKRMVIESGKPAKIVAKEARISYTLMYDLMNDKQQCTAYAASQIAGALGYQLHLITSRRYGRTTAMSEATDG